MAEWKAKKDKKDMEHSIMAGKLLDYIEKQSITLPSEYVSFLNELSLSRARIRNGFLAQNNLFVQLFGNLPRRERRVSAVYSLGDAQEMSVCIAM